MAPDAPPPREPDEARPATQTAPRRFVWPPRPPVRVEIPPVADAGPPLRAAGPVSLIESVEDTWLDLVDAPMDRRMAQADWRPDDEGRYCTRCGRTCAPYARDAEGCPHCRGRRWPWTQTVRLGSYAGVLRAFVHDVKFTAWRQLGDRLGRRLGEAVRARHERLCDTLGERRVIVTPVPTSLPRRLARGIDHPLVIARGVAKALGAPATPLLRRAHRPAQTSLAASTRARNVAGTMRPSRWARWRWSKLLREDPGRVLVVMVDDVTTTGATLRATARAIRGMFGTAGARGQGESRLEIWAAVLSVTEPRVLREGDGGSGLNGPE